MLLFSAMLEINDSLTKDTFIRLVIAWNHDVSREEDEVPKINWHGERSIRYGTDNLWIGIEEYRNQNIIAVRHEKKEKNGVIWNIDYVTNFNTRKMAVRLDRSYLGQAFAVDNKFRTPCFITMLIQGGYLRDDEGLPILASPLIIDESNTHLLVDLINGKCRYRLPVVYVSKTLYDEDPVDIDALSGRLNGVAHVFVQKSNCQNRKLKALCDRKNEYYGAIGIYYPSQAAGHKKYFYRSASGEDFLQAEKVIRAVIQYSNSQMVEALYTWQGVNNALLRDRLASQREGRRAAEQAQKAAEQEALRLLDSLDEEERRIRTQAMEDAHAEADKILEGFDEDMTRLQRQVEELTHANESLQHENYGLREKLHEADAIPLLFMGEELEFYQGEVKDLILSALCDALPNIQQKSRRADVVQDIIQSNDYQREGERRAEEVKRLLRKYDGMTGKLRQELANLGFEITEDGKHFKICYFGDNRYHTVFAKTPSDGRSGKNSAANVIKMAF